jgi:hypothetical protein
MLLEILIAYSVMILVTAFGFTAYQVRHEQNVGSGLDTALVGVAVGIIWPLVLLALGINWLARRLFGRE